MCELLQDFTLERINNIIINSIVDIWNSYKINNSKIDIQVDDDWIKWISWVVCVVFDPRQFTIVYNSNRKDQLQVDCDIAMNLINNVNNNCLHNSCLHNIIEYIQLLYTHHTDDGKFAYQYFKKSWNAYYYDKYIYGIKISKRRRYFIIRHYAYSYLVYSVCKHNYIKNAIIVNNKSGSEYITIK